MLIEADPEADEESDMETLKARAPPDLDARIPRDGMETPPIPPHPSELAEEVRVEDREDGPGREDDLDRAEVHAPPTPAMREGRIVFHGKLLLLFLQNPTSRLRQ